MTRVPAADNTLRILDFLSSQRGPVPAQMVATALGLPRSSAYHLLTVMTERGYVTHVPEEKRYGL
ncbi:MAG: helix-turn-helix domain-containing protein, partial [Microbacteriaceae bacterium]